MKAVVVVFFAVLATLSLAQLPSTFYSGYVNVDASAGANLFYFMVPSQSNPASDPVILWLQGGPGCSSMFGNWVEQGPYVIQKDGTFKANPYTWNKNATMIYIDSPVGTGFSYVKGEDYPSDEKTIADDLYTAVSSILFTLQPSFSSNPFYVFGESYGGKYVPWLASTIIAQNASPKSGKKINLKGIGIGNGWVDPYIQTGSYAPFLYRHKLITQAELNSASKTYKQYQQLIDQGEYAEAAQVGFGIMNDLMSDAGLGDPYDIRKSSDPTTPLGNKLATYLNKPATMKAIKAKDGVVWELCDQGPYYALMNDIDRASFNLLPGILANIPVMLYNGDCDLICDMDGTASYASQISWPGQSAYLAASNVTWNGPSGAAAGTYQSGGGLVRAVVYQAGHMVPYDQPANAQYLVWKFLTGQFN